MFLPSIFGGLYLGHPFRLAVATLKTACFAHVCWEYLYSTEPCGGASMLPTLEVMGDAVLISKKYRRGRNVQVGDVIAFDSVVQPGERVIKRVVGMEGDYVLRDTPGTNEKMIQVCSSMSST
jgi:inner membrane protease subunit 1